MPYLNAEQRDEVRHLIALMKHPRYWRDQDPEVQRTVRLGLRRLYRGEMPSEAAFDPERRGGSDSAAAAEAPRAQTG